jgi:hypothetical protein
LPRWPKAGCSTAELGPRGLAESSADQGRFAADGEASAGRSGTAEGLGRGTPGSGVPGVSWRSGEGRDVSGGNVTGASPSQRRCVNLGLYRGQKSRSVDFPRHTVENSRRRLSPCHGKVKVDSAPVIAEVPCSSARLREEPGIPATPPARPPQASPASLAPLPALQAVSATASACQGRRREGSVPYLGRQPPTAASLTSGASSSRPRRNPLPPPFPTPKMQRKHFGFP